MDASAHLRKKKHMIHYANHLSLSGNNVTSSHRATGGLHMSIVEGAIHMEVKDKEKIVKKYNAPVPTSASSPPVEVPVEAPVVVVAEVPVEILVEPTPVPVEAPVEVPAEVPVEVSA
jgi:hypothetical protein